MTYSLHRRDMLKVVGLAAAGFIAPAYAADTQAAPKYAPKPLPFDPTKLTGLSEKLIVSHHDNNYVGAVNRLNQIGAQLATLDFAAAPGFLVNGLKREELIAANSMILHELYFAGFGAPTQPGKMLADAIVRDFGSLDRWKAEFTAMGRAEGGGSGWVLLTYSPRDKRLMNTWAADHTMTLASGEPLLALDMYEHAYHMDFGSKAADYVNAFMANLNWSNADQIFTKRHV